jgi:hypothetical protein
MIKNHLSFALPLAFTIVCILFNLQSEKQNESQNEFVSIDGNKHITGDFNRDNNLKNLIHILNNNSNLFQSWAGNERNYINFIHILEPYILMPPAFPKNPILPFIIPILNEEDSVDCMHPDYSGVLTGEKLHKPKFIIDFVPFGYDIDKLELRFYEYYDLVDVIVIYESPRTLSGLYKPLYYDMIKDDARFIPFRKKIIYLSSTAEEIKQDEVKTRIGEICV